VLKLRCALQEMMQFNRIRNDLEAYLYALGEWALGDIKEKPNPEDYGLTKNGGGEG